MQYERASFSFTRAVQPKDYETTRATGELSVVFEEGEQPDVTAILRGLSGEVQSHVLAAVGKDPAVAGVVGAAKSEAKVEAKGTGKTESAPAEAPAEPEGAHAGKGGEPERKITDKDLSDAAYAMASREGSSEKVVQLIKDYGLDRLTHSQGATRVELYDKLMGNA